MLEDPKSKHNVRDDKRTPYTFRGKTIVLAKQTGPKPGGLVAKGMEKGIFPDAKKIEAVTLYAVLGKVVEVARLTDVPADRIRKWRKELWWMEMLAECRRENNEKIDAQFTDIIENSLEALQDRVRNGDFVLNRKGDLVRKPIAAKELAIVAAINVDKRQLLRGEPTHRSENVGKVEDTAVNRLEKLAETFENLARFGRQPRLVDLEAKKVEGEVVDVAVDGEIGAGALPAAPEGHSEGQVPKGEVS